MLHNISVGVRMLDNIYSVFLGASVDNTQYPSMNEHSPVTHHNNG